MKIPVPLIHTFVWKILGSIVIFLLINTKLFAAAPPNDACANAVSLTAPSTICSTTAGTLFSATNAAPTGGCGGATATTTYDVWYKFTANSTGVVATLSALGTKLTAASTYVEVLTGTCGSFTSLGCLSGTAPLNVTGL